jgi:hypothetical protein
MPQKKKMNKQKQAGREVVLEAEGFGVRGSLRFPIPRLPSWLGAGNRLMSNAAVYPRVDLDFPMAVINVPVASGAVAQVVNFDASTLIPNWSSRIQNLFREYCIVGARFEFTLTGVTNAQGCVVIFVDETLATAPNAGSMFVPHLEVPIVQYPGEASAHPLTLSYKPSGSYTDLEWTPCASPVTRTWLKFFASTANTGTGASTTAVILVRGTLALAFRGYANF